MNTLTRLWNLRISLLLLSIVAASSQSPLSAQTPDLYDMDTVRDFHLTFHQTNYWSLLGANKSSRTDIKADLIVDNKLYKDVGVRFRGNTSYSYNYRRSQKLPFNIRMDAFVPGQELYGYQNLNLANAYKDATFVREPIAYLLMRKHVPSLKANWIKLHINNQYWGVYVMVEQATKDYLRDWFQNEDGNLYRGDAPARNSRPTLTWLGTNSATYARYYDLKTEGHPKPWVDLIQLCNVLNNTSMANLPGELPKVMNVDRALWYLALQNIFSNTDSYIGTGNDYLAFNDETHGRFQMMPWDLNTCFGGYDWPGKRLGAQGLKKMDPFYDGGTSLSRPLMTRIWAVPKWRERYLAHFRTMLADWWDWKTVEPIVNKYHKMLEPHVKADTKKLYSTQAFLDNITKDVVVQDSYGSYTIPGLKSFVETKRTFLLGHAAVNKTAPVVGLPSHVPANPTSTQSLTVTARMTGAVSKAILHWRHLGAFHEDPMFDDGKHGDGAANDSVYGAFIPPQAGGALVEYYASAETTSGVMTFGPRRTTQDLREARVQWDRGASVVLINEVLTKNTKGIKDEANEYEDWVELYNTSSTEVDLSGMYLSDKVANSTKWKIPSGTKIKPNGFLLFWADEDAADGPLHLNFKLSKGGEVVHLFAADGKTLLQRLEFGQQDDDVSLGRLFDGKGKDLWVTFPASSPLALNAPKACGNRSYGPPVPDQNPVLLEATTQPKIASTLQLTMKNGAPNLAFFNLLASGSGYWNLNNRFMALIAPPLIVWTTPSDAAGKGASAIPIPDDAKLVGAKVYFQSLSWDPKGLFASNALEVTLCPK